MCDFCWPTILRIIGLVRNCPTLFWIGATASTSNFEEYLLNSSTQNWRTTGSVTFSIALLRYSLSDKIRITPSRVLSGCSSNARIALRKTYSTRGPHESAHIFLKIEMRPEE